MARFGPEVQESDPWVGETEARRVAIGEVYGQEVEIEQSAVRSVVGEDVELEQSAVVFARAARMKIKGAAAIVVAARTVEAENLRAVFILSPSVKGNVRTLFDLRTAFAVGAGFFLARLAIRIVTGLGRGALRLHRG